MRTFALAFVAALIALPAAAEQQITLKKAPGVDKVEANCQACHSLAYIPMNSPFLNAAGWDATVNKMIKALGAPIGGGGRYDDLLARFGRPLPAVGFALGIDRLHIALTGEERGTGALLAQPAGEQIA